MAGLPRWLSGKESTCMQEFQEGRFNPWVQRCSGGRHGRPTPYAAGDPMGREPDGLYGLWGRKELDMTGDLARTYARDDESSWS